MMKHSLTNQVRIILFIFLLAPSTVLAAIPKPTSAELLRSQIKPQASQKVSLIFDLPVTYNSKVTKWVTYFQTRGQRWFRTWLERSTLHMPRIQTELARAGLPQDLAFMVMIESGFNPVAVSHAAAVGPWQFIESTGKRYGLKVTPWLDERRDWDKATRAAIGYLTDLHREFGSWYLVAASYNMGENGLRRQIKRHKTRDFWKLAELRALPKETIDYVPKILAAMIISKAPALYGFRNIPIHEPLTYEHVQVPGGTYLDHIADELGVTHKSLYDLNAELLQKKVPASVQRHTIRVPKGASLRVAQLVENKLGSSIR